MTMAAIGVGVVGAGAAYYASTKASSANSQLGNTQRNSANELGSFWKDPKNTQGMLAYQNQAANQNAQTQYNIAQMGLGLYPQINAAQIAGQTQTRQANLSDLQNMGGQYQQAILSNSPLMANSLNQANNMVQTAGQADPLAQQLNATALSQLQLGSGLSDEQVRNATQATDQGLASRGMAMAQRQSQALGVENQNQTRVTQGQNFTLNAAQTGQNSLSPMLGMFNQQPVSVMAANQFVNGQTATNAALQGSNSLMGYDQDVNSSNYNAQLDALRMQSNQYSALAGSSIGATGQIGSALIKNGGTTNTTLGSY